MIGGHSASAFYSVKLCVMINFSLRRNVLCFSFVAVLYSKYSLYAIVKVVLLNERGLSPLTRSTDHQSLLKHFAHFLRGGDDSYLKSDF